MAERKPGVQQEDVDRAALMIKSRGEIVTVDRVRKQIGRGSPNTITPLLHQWRMEQSVVACSELEVSEVAATEHVHDDTPEELGIMARAIWARAKKLAAEKARRELEEQSFALSQSQAALVEREEKLQTDERRIYLAKEHLEEAVSAAQGEAQRWRDSHQTAENECVALAARLSEAAAELERQGALIESNVIELARRDESIGELGAVYAGKVERVVAAFLRADEERRCAKETADDLQARLSRLEQCVSHLEVLLRAPLSEANRGLLKAEVGNLRSVMNHTTGPEHCRPEEHIRPGG